MPRRPRLTDYDGLEISQQRARLEYTLALSYWADHQLPQWLAAVKAAARRRSNGTRVARHNGTG